MERLEHTCVSHQDSYLDSVDLMFSYLWTAFYVTLGTRISHDRDVKTSRFGELFLRNGGPKWTVYWVFYAYVQLFCTMYEKVQYCTTVQNNKSTRVLHIRCVCGMWDTGDGSYMYITPDGGSLFCPTG